MRIAIFGVGGVGGYFGGRLAQAGEDVVFIARGQQLEALRQRGLRVDSPDGEFVVYPVQATDSPAEVGIVDCILVCVKAWQVPEAAKAMQPMIGADTMVLPLQNGVQAQGQLAAVVGVEHVLGGLCGIIALIAGPGHICHVGAKPFIKFGEMDNRRSDRIERLREVFQRMVHVAVTIPPDIEAAIWEKFIFIAPTSGVGSVARAPFGILRNTPETREMIEQAMIEILEVARARGVALPETAVKHGMALLDAAPADGTSSMQRDIMAGRRSELDAQSGTVLHLGAEVGVNTPVHRFIYWSLVPLEMRARGEVKF